MRYVVVQLGRNRPDLSGLSRRERVEWFRAYHSAFAARIIKQYPDVILVKVLITCSILDVPEELAGGIGEAFQCSLIPADTPLELL